MKTVKILPVAGVAIFLTACTPAWQQQQSLSQLDRRAEEVKLYAQRHGYSTRYCFLMDLSLQSGLKRFFVYDLAKMEVAYSGLVAHGNCDQNFLKTARFSNTLGGGCTSVGLYKVGNAYRGQYGKAYKLFGLENSNSNAFKRAIVLHGNSFIPDEEAYPKYICNSSGCPMVSFGFFKNLSSIIDQSSTPILLWVYDRPKNPIAALLKPSLKPGRY